MKKRKPAPKCPQCKGDDTRQFSSSGIMLDFYQCFSCRNTWAKDKGPAYLGDSRPGYGWPVTT